MTQPIEDVVSAVVALIEPLSGIEQVPINPPETVNVATFAMVYAESGAITLGTVGTAHALHNIVVYLLTKKVDVATDIGRVKPFIDTISNALRTDPTLTATVQTFESLSYEFLEVDYAGVQMIGYKFLINNAKILV